MFTKVFSEKEKIKLSGFNNLTKVLSFNLYDFCITVDDKQKGEYLEYINEHYSAEKITDVCKEICKIIEAQVLGYSKQDYDPTGASTTLLMSDSCDSEACNSKGSTVTLHLDKSHITAHTYPDVADPNGICSFRVDIDIATCGEIIPLKAINYLFKRFESDVVYINYVVRGYTRLEDGKKIYNDRSFNSIQEFIDEDILSIFEHRTDLSLPNENIWQTKLMVKDFDVKRYLIIKDDSKRPEMITKMNILQEEMKEVFHMIN